MPIRHNPFRRRPTAGALVLVFAGLCAVSPIIGEPILSGPGDVRLLLRSVQEASLPASSAVTQDVGTVWFEPADEAAARWLDSLRASSPSNALPVLVFEEPTTSDIVATNLESGGAARIEPEDDYDPMWVLDSLNGLDPDIRDRLIPFFDPSLVSVRFVLRPVAVRPVAVRLLPDSGPGTVRGAPKIATAGIEPASERDRVGAGIVSSVENLSAATTNAPSAAPVPAIRRLVVSSTANRLLLLPVSDATTDRFSVNVQGKVAAGHGLDLRGRPGIVRISSGSTLSARPAVDAPRRTLILLPDAAETASFGPTGTVGRVSIIGQGIDP